MIEKYASVLKENTQVRNFLEFLLYTERYDSGLKSEAS